MSATRRITGTHSSRNDTRTTTTGMATNVSAAKSSTSGALHVYTRELEWV